MKLRFTCGTKAVDQIGPNDFRVICATCLGGGTVQYGRLEDAERACVQQSTQPCRRKGCGAA